MGKTFFVNKISILVLSFECKKCLNSWRQPSFENIEINKFDFGPCRWRTRRRCSVEWWRKCKWPPSRSSNVPRRFGVPIKIFSCRINVLVSANLPSDVGVVSWVKFVCCILNSGVCISQFTFCRSGTIWWL